MGHVTLLTDQVLGLLERHGERLGEDLGSVRRGEDWLEYVEQAHRETKVRNGLVLGGAKAPPPPESEESANDGSGGVGGDSYNALFASGTDEALARYFCQQVIASLPNRFVFNGGGIFDEEDDEDELGFPSDRFPWRDEEEEIDVDLDVDVGVEEGEERVLVATTAGVGGGGLHNGRLQTERICRGRHVLIDAPDETATPSITIPVEPNGLDTMLEMEMRLSSLGDFSGDSLSGSDEGEVWDPHFERRRLPKTPDRDPNLLTTTTMTTTTASGDSSPSSSPTSPP